METPSGSCYTTLPYAARRILAVNGEKRVGSAFVVAAWRLPVASIVLAPVAYQLPAPSTQLPEDFAASSGAITRNDAHSFHVLRGLQPTAYRPDVSYPGTRFATTVYSAPMSISSPAWQSWVRAYWSLRESAVHTLLRADRSPASLPRLSPSRVLHDRRKTRPLKICLGPQSPASPRRDEPELRRGTGGCLELAALLHGMSYTPRTKSLGLST